MEMRSPLARVRGLGSSNDGIHHWWVQRLTGIALIPLVLWFVLYAVGLASADLATVKAWVGAHYNPVLLILLIICMFHHGQLGLQVVIEDYVGRESVKFAALILVQGTSIVLGLIGVLSVLLLLFRV